MPGLRIDQLPWPDPPYRVDLLNPAFETTEQAIDRDARHARSIRKTASQSSSSWAALAVDLANRIDPVLSPNTPSSLASARYLRAQRILFTGNLHHLVESVGVANVVRADIIKPGLTRDLEGFLAEDPARVMNEFRTDLMRAGMSKCNGFLVGAYHNEFDPLGQQFGSHGHFLVGGEYVPALERLRKFRTYKPTPSVRVPIRISRQLTNLPYALSYILKSYWVSRPMLPLGANGGPKRPRKGQRIPEPYHTQVLMWLDQFVLSELILLMGVNIRKSGLLIRH